jgi:protein translocase SecG subunit
LLTFVLYAIFILACIVLIVAVLLQPGKADAGALFSSSVSSAAFGPRGTQTLLAKITIGAAAAFMLAALALALPFIAGSRSVLQGEDAPQTQPTPAAPAASPAAPPAPGEAPATNTNAAPANTNAAATAPANSASPAPAANVQTAPAGSPQTPQK